MLGNTQIETVVVLEAKAAADTAAATSGWINVRNYEGSMLIIANVGAVAAGQIAGKIQTASDGSGTGAADVSGATFTTVTTSNDPHTQGILVPCNACGPYIAYIGTITTGPVDVGVTLTAQPKY